MPAKSRTFEFPGSMAAKDFIVSRIMVEAGKENVPVSEIERKMLYFSETYPTLPDIWELSDKFNSEYETAEYERKMAKLIANAIKADRKESPQLYDQWRAAVRLLRREDHYVLVLVDQSGISIRPRGDTAKLLLTATAIAAIAILYGFLSASHSLTLPDFSRIRRFGNSLSVTESFEYFIGFVVVYLVFYLVFPHVLGFFGARRSQRRK